MNTYNKIILCAVSIAALFLLMGLFASAANDGVYKLIAIPSDLGEGTTVDVYDVSLEAGAQKVGHFSSADFTNVIYDGNSGFFTFKPFSQYGEIYMESVSSIEFNLSIPFVSLLSGKSFQSLRLDKDNYLTSIDLNMVLQLAAPDLVNGGTRDYFKRSLDFSIVMNDGTQYVIENDNFDTGTSSPFYRFSANDINLPASEISHFYLEFAIYSYYDTQTGSYVDRIDHDAELVFGYSNPSYITIENQSEIAGGLIDDANDSVTDSIKKGDDVIGEIDKVVGDPQVDLDNINTDGLSQYGEYFYPENTVTILAFSLAVTSLGIATIGYILHGKRG